MEKIDTTILSQLSEEIAKFMEKVHKERERRKRITPLSDDVIRYITTAKPERM